MYRVDFQAMQRRMNSVRRCNVRREVLGMNGVRWCDVKMNSVRISISLIFSRYYFKN